MTKRLANPKPFHRPKLDLDPKLVANAAGIGCTVDEIAALLGCSRRLIFQRIADDPEFAEAIESGRAKGRATLRRYQWQAAAAGNATMQIWLGKQLLGQRDYANIDEISASPTASPSGGDKVFKFTLKIGDRRVKTEDDEPISEMPLIEHEPV